MKKNKLFSLVCFFVLIIATITTIIIYNTSFGGSDIVEIYYYYSETCDSCNGENDIYKIARDKLDSHDTLPEYTIKATNVFTLEGLHHFEAIVEEYQINSIEQDFPLLIINGNVIYGLDNIESDIYEHVLASE